MRTLFCVNVNDITPNFSVHFYCRKINCLNSSKIAISFKKIKKIENLWNCNLFLSIISVSLELNTTSFCQRYSSALSHSVVVIFITWPTSSLIIATTCLFVLVLVSFIFSFLKWKSTFISLENYFSPSHLFTIVIFRFLIYKIDHVLSFRYQAVGFITWDKTSTTHHPTPPLPWSVSVHEDQLYSLHNVSLLRKEKIYLNLAQYSLPR